MRTAALALACTALAAAILGRAIDHAVHDALCDALTPTGPPR